MIQALESRIHLAMSVGMDKATLKVQGSDKSDVINIAMANAQIVVSINASTFTIPAARVKKISVNGGKGNDRITIDDSVAVSADLFGGDGNDYLHGGKKPCRLWGQAGNDTLVGGPAADFFSGGPGIDTVDYSSRTEDLRITLDGKANDGAAVHPGYGGENDNISGDIENVIGGSGNDYIVGNNLPNTLIGGPGNDTLIGLGGNDLLVGGSGADLLVGGDGDDVLLAIDKSADDTLIGGNGFDSAAIDSVAGVMDKLLGIENVVSVLG